ncbi:TPA: hypothetical protein U0583_002130 [Streptococcus suis]|nr:hypothetical protein [Streptococcus suis]
MNARLDSCPSSLGLRTRGTVLGLGSLGEQTKPRSPRACFRSLARRLRISHR